MKVTWDDVLAGYRGQDVRIKASDKDGLYTITINDEVLLNATRSEAMLVFLGLSKMFGRKASRQLLRLKADKSMDERYL